MRMALSAAAALWGLALTPGARAADLCLSHPVRMALYEAGYFYFNGKGIDHDIAQELRRRTGCAIETSAPPRVRAYAMLESGQADIVMAALVNHERDEYAVFVPYMQQRFATLIHRDVPLAKTTLNGFIADPSLHFGAIRGVNYGAGRDAVYAQMEAQHRLEIGPTLPLLFRMFKSRRFDAMFAVPLQFEKELADAGMRDSVRVVDWFPGAPSSERSLAMSRKNFSAEQVRGWREVVQSMKADGTMRRILSRYLPPGEVAKALIK